MINVAKQKLNFTDKEKPAMKFIFTYLGLPSKDSSHESLLNDGDWNDPRASFTDQTKVWSSLHVFCGLKRDLDWNM